MFDGKMGSGKTAGMSVLALDWQLRSGCTLFSNYGLTGSIPFTNFEDFKKVAVQSSSIICLDESHMDLSNRDYAMNSVKFFITMIWFLRKMRCTLMMTSPLFENIDSKVRAVTNLYINVSKRDGYLNYNYYDMESETLIKRNRISLETMKRIGSYLYDTYEMVTPLEYPKNRDDFNLVIAEVKRLNKEYMSQNRADKIRIS